MRITTPVDEKKTAVPYAEQQPTKKLRSERQREVFQRCQEARKKQVEAIRARKIAIKAERQAQRRRQTALVKQQNREDPPLASDETTDLT